MPNFSSVKGVFTGLLPGSTFKKQNCIRTALLYDNTIGVKFCAVLLFGSLHSFNIYLK